MGIIRIILVLIFVSITLYFGYQFYLDSVKFDIEEKNFNTYGCYKPIVKPGLVMCP